MFKLLNTIKFLNTGLKFIYILALRNTQKNAYF